MFTSIDPPVVELDLSLKNNVIIRAGTTLRLPAHITGRPPPYVKWTKDDGTPNKERVEIESEGKQSVLIIKNITRKDEGKYQVIAANSSGTKSAWTRVEVYGNKNLLVLITCLNYVVCFIMLF